MRRLTTAHSCVDTVLISRFFMCTLCGCLHNLFELKLLVSISLLRDYIHALQAVST